jgi:hypothetical protein
MPGPVRPAQRRASWHPVSHIPPRAGVHTDGLGGLRPTCAPVGSRVEDRACAWHEMERRDGRGAKPAPGHRRSGAGAGQAVRPAGLRPVHKGRRYRQAGSEAMADVSAARQPRSLRSSGAGASALRGRLRPDGADHQGHTGVRRRGGEGGGEQADRRVPWLAHTPGGPVHSVGDAWADWPRLEPGGPGARPRPPGPWPPRLGAPGGGAEPRGLATHATEHTPSASWHAA